MRSICLRPRMFVADGFLSAEEVEHVLGLERSPEALAARGLSWTDDETGFAFELPVAGDAVLEGIRERLERVTGLRNRRGKTFRYRHYRPGQSHPPHGDNYNWDGLDLVATAMMSLTTPERGGQTVFSKALPEEQRVEARAGRLTLWFNHDLMGEPEEAAHHEALAVEAGEKITITAFIYGRRSDAAMVPPGLRRESTEGRRFVCVDDDVPVTTLAMLEQAALERGLEYVEVQARSFDFDPERRVEPGDLLYRPAVSTAAVRVEQFLFAEGAATFYAEDRYLLFAPINAPLLMQRAGVPVPRTVYLANANRELLDGLVERLGGYPVVLKMLGFSGGIGVMRLDSAAALYSLADYALSQGHNPLLCAYVPDALHWRVIVVGDRAVAAYENPLDEQDFRSSGTSDATECTAEVEPELAETAIRATHALGAELGGVDLLEHPSGRLYVLESNFPCYFGHAQELAGIDVAGAMMDHLLGKARRLAPR